jgi:hypothetical protein
MINFEGSAQWNSLILSGDQVERLVTCAHKFTVQAFNQTVSALNTPTSTALNLLIKLRSHAFKPKRTLFGIRQKTKGDQALWNKEMSCSASELLTL